MRKRRAAVGTAVMAVGPSTVVGVVPWLLTRWEVRDPVPGGMPARVLGALLVGSGAVVLTHCFGRFVTEGVGTPAPIAPPENLVVGGLYRHVRNPMYLAMAAAVAGQACVLGQPKLLLYPVIAALPVASFVGSTRNRPWPGGSAPTTRSTAATFLHGCPDCDPGSLLSVPAGIESSSHRAGQGRRRPSRRSLGPGRHRFEQVTHVVRHRSSRQSATLTGLPQRIREF